MPRAKKEIHMELHIPPSSQLTHFQERVNAAYIDSLRNYLRNMEAEKDVKEEILDALIRKYS